jgi:glycosyltransferase involved in cell wall biosynthesis
LKKKSDILIIIPAYNEAASIGGVLQSLKKHYSNFDIVVVDDASKDNTAEIAKSSACCFIINLPYNIGIGGSVQTGFKFAKQYKYKYAIQFDADGQHLVGEIEKILTPVMEGEADCAIGSRFVQSDDNYKPDIPRRMGIYILRLFSFLYIGQRITDQTSGFRAYNRKIIDILADSYPKDYPEPEILVMLGRSHFKIKEVFTQMRERQGGVSSIPIWRGPYYIIKVILAMSIARIRRSRNSYS